MECRIITVHDSRNCGSFLQAYALKIHAEHVGYSVSYHPREWFEKDKSSRLKALAHLLMFNFSKAKIAYESNRNYLAALKMFQESDDIDRNCIYILGSDTIWDAKRKRYIELFDRYWGLQFSKHKVISYAPSSGNALREDYTDSLNIGLALNNMSAISVRDKKTYDIIRQYTSEKIEIVCDPTFLLTLSDYVNIEGECPFSNFILLYCYGTLETDIVERIKAIANERNLSVVSFGIYRDWCHASIPNDPFDFLAFYHKADFVITNTFHGTVFSIIYMKSFVATAFKKDKVVDLLDRYGLKEQLAYCPDDIEKCLNHNIDYLSVTERVNNHRNLSIKYLDSSLTDATYEE